MITRFVLTWLDLANRGAAQYQGLKRFYELKTWILESYGTPDGWDKQVIQHKCWYCNGERECGNCAKGIYRTAITWLKRYRLGGHLYHTIGRPEEAASYAELFTGKIPHEEVDYMVARKAAILCYFWFQPIELLRMWIYLKLQNRGLVYWGDEAWWPMTKSAATILALRCRARLFPDLEDKDVPF